MKYLAVLFGFCGALSLSLSMSPPKKVERIEEVVIKVVEHNNQLIDSVNKLYETKYYNNYTYSITDSKYNIESKEFSNN